MTTADQLACTTVIQSWGLYRDQCRWDELRDTFVPEGTIAISWFRGPYVDFVERVKNRGPRAGRAKHLFSPSVVTLRLNRAVAETNVVIQVRQKIEGISIDLTSYARFLDRLEQRNNDWLIVERVGIYEKDRMDPVEPSPAFDAMIANANCSRFRPEYRYMEYRVAAAGLKMVDPVYCDDMPETLELRQRYASWLQELG